MATWVRICVLAVVSTAPFAVGATPDRAPLEDEAWTWLSEQIGTVHARGEQLALPGDDRAVLQERLPDVDVVDIAWTRNLMEFDRSFLAVRGITADALLARLDDQLVRTASTQASTTSLALLLRPGNAVENPEDAADLDRALWARLDQCEAGEEFRLVADRVRELPAAAAMLVWARYAMRLDAKAMELFHVTAHDLLHMADYQLLRKVRTDAYVAALSSRIKCADPGASDHDGDCGGASGGVPQPICDQGTDEPDAVDAFCRLSAITGRLCTAAPSPSCHGEDGTRGDCLDDGSGDAGAALPTGDREVSMSFAPYNAAESGQHN